VFINRIKMDSRIYKDPVCTFVKTRKYIPVGLCESYSSAAR
jgi:hypothetical protein